MPGLVRVSGGQRGVFDGPRPVGVSMRREVLDHKLRRGKRAQQRYAFWNFARAPDTDFTIRSKLWVASEGRWRGYFVVHALVGNGTEAWFYSESWVEKDGGPRKPFQGFTYKVPEAA